MVIWEINLGKKYKGYCYYCGDKATSFEHAPPRHMFKGFSCDSITVPSCDEHNARKSGNDHAIVSAFLIPLLNGRDVYKLEPEIERAITLAMPSFDLAKKKTMSAQIIKNSSSDLPKTSYLSADALFWHWMRQLTAALIFDATETFIEGVNWNELPAWSPHRIQSENNEPMEFEKAASLLQEKDDIKKKLEELKWLDGWSAYPNRYPPIIYRFKIHFNDSEILFCHKFYNRYDCYVLAKLPFEILAKIFQKAAVVHSDI
jgi:hypothetical protein